MKKILFAIALLVNILPVFAQSDASNFVDLGLPSGTKWKTHNEEGPNGNRYRHQEAISQFGNSLPSKEQWLELTNTCEWTWTGNGCKVTGPNGNYITLPAEGKGLCKAGEMNVGTCGYYWSSTTIEYKGTQYMDAWMLQFASTYMRMMSIERCPRLSVRLVQN